MSEDITKLSTAELKADLAETKTDIIVCQNALAAGITEYSPGSAGSTQYRLDTNIKIESLIEEELERRD